MTCAYASRVLCVPFRAVPKDAAVIADGGDPREREIVAAYERGYAVRPQAEWLGELGLVLLADLVSRQRDGDAVDERT